MASTARPKSSTRIRLAAVILISLALALLLAEGGARLLGHHRPCFAAPCIQETGQQATGHYYLQDPLLGWRNIPGYTSETWGNSLNINSLGLRGPEVTLGKPSGTRRVLLLGDSFIWGLGVADDSTLSTVLAHELHRRGRPHQVLNAGVSGWSTDQQHLYLKRDGIKLKPDVVVVGFFLLNDTVELNASRIYGLAKPQYSSFGLDLVGTPVPLLIESSARGMEALEVGAVCGLSALCRIIAWSAPGRPALRRVMTGLGLTRVQPFRDRDFHLDPIDLALALFKGINRTCRAAGAKLVVMKFGAFLHQTGKDKLRDFVLTDQATRLEAGITKQVQGAHYLDLDAAFKRKGLTASTLTLPEDAYHWNHKGHIASAHILAEFLGARGLLMEAP